MLIPLLNWKGLFLQRRALRAIPHLFFKTLVLHPVCPTADEVEHALIRTKRRQAKEKEKEKKTASISASHVVASVALN
jgi:hypothetical protein